MKLQFLNQTIESTIPKKEIINNIEKFNISKIQSKNNNTYFSKYVNNVQKNLFKTNNSNDNKKQLQDNRIFHGDTINEPDFTLEKSKCSEEELDSNEYISSTNLDVETNTYINSEKNSEYEKNVKNIKVKLNSNEKTNKIIKIKFNDTNNANIKFHDFFKNCNKNIINNPKINFNSNINDNKPKIYKKVDINIFNSNNTINNQKTKKSQLKNFNSAKMLKNKNKIEREKNNLNNPLINNNTNITANEKNYKRILSKNEIYSDYFTDPKKTNKVSICYNSNTNANTNANTKSNTKSNTNINLNKDNSYENFIYDKAKNFSFINNINSQNTTNSLNNKNNNCIIFSPLKVIKYNIDEKTKTPYEINHSRPVFSPNLELINSFCGKNDNAKILYAIPKKNIKKKIIIPYSNRDTNYSKNNDDSNNLIYINKKNNIISLNKARKNQFHTSKTSKNRNNTNKIQIRKYFSFVSNNKKNDQKFHSKYNSIVLSLDDQRKNILFFSPKSQQNIFNKNNYNLNPNNSIKIITNRIIPKKDIFHNKVISHINPSIKVLNTIDNNPIFNNMNNLNNNTKLSLNNEYFNYQRSLNHNNFDNILNIPSEKKNYLYKSPLQKSEIIIVKNNSKTKYKHNHSLSNCYNNYDNNNTINYNSCRYNKIGKNNKIFSHKKGENHIKIPIDFINNTNILNSLKNQKDSINENIINNSINFKTNLTNNNTITPNNNCLNNYIESDSAKRKINFKQQITPINSSTRKIKKFIPIDRKFPNITNRKLVPNRYTNIDCDNYNTITNVCKSFSNKDYIYSMSYKDIKMKK